MLEKRVVVKQFSARHWSDSAQAHQVFEPGEQLIALRHESGYSIFVRASDPVRHYIIDIDDFRTHTISSGVPGRVGPTAR
jgi:hypothetical protein